MTGPASSIASCTERLSSLGLVPIVERPVLDQAGPLFEALCEGGLPAAEVTLRTPEALDVIKVLAASYPEALIGAGTVRSIEDAARVIGAGASFVVCPGMDLEIVAFCLAQGVLVLPGTATPTEVHLGLKAGAEVLKFFPAEILGGPAYLKALSGPFAEARFVPTGGINTANLAGYLQLPQVLACGGSWMVASSLVADGDFSRVRDLTSAAVALVKEVRGSA